MVILSVFLLFYRDWTIEISLTPILRFRWFSVKVFQIPDLSSFGQISSNFRNRYSIGSTLFSVRVHFPKLAVVIDIAQQQADN